jgi:hypothetical protein
MIFRVSTLFRSSNTHSPTILLAVADHYGSSELIFVSSVLCMGASWEDKLNFLIRDNFETAFRRLKQSFARPNGVSSSLSTCRVRLSRRPYKNAWTELVQINSISFRQVLAIFLIPNKNNLPVIVLVPLE